MKKIIFGLVAATLLVTGTIFVIAQKSGDKTGHGFGHDGRGHRGGIVKALRALDLTDDQKAKVREILETSRTSIQPLMEQAKANHGKIRSLGTNGTFDQAEVAAIAAEQGDVTAKLIIEKEKAKAQIFALLTDEQKAKAETMRAKFEEKFKAHTANFEKPADLEF